MYVLGICRLLLKMVVKVFFGPIVLTLVLRWCINRMCMAKDSICGLFNSRGMFGSLYVNISIGIHAITCVSRKGSMCGVKF